MTLIKNIYKMVSTDIAPRLHSVTQEVINTYYRHIQQNCIAMRFAVHCVLLVN